MLFFKRNKKKNKPEAEKPPVEQGADSGVQSPEVTESETEVPVAPLFESSPQPEVVAETDDDKIRPVEPATEETVATLEPKAEISSADTVDEATAAPEAPVVKQAPSAVEQEPSAVEQEPSATEENPSAPAEEKKLGFFARIKKGLSRTSTQFSEGLGNLLLGKKAIDDELLEEIETQLLVADVGIDATTEIIDNLTAKVARKQLSDSGALYEALQEELYRMLQPVEQPMAIDSGHKPYVILVVGVNGVGKTTTIGKLAKRLQNEGRSVMLAAGDTFRAAAVEQLQIWGERNKVPVVAQHTGADSASVIYDAVSSAQARGVDVIIADTAGRLHNKGHLMNELEKVRRVMGKLDASAPHEVLLVLDAGTGQNAVNQADIFLESAGVTGVALTKLDGTAKGGVIFALTKKHQLPIRYIGVGESIDDLQPFSAKAFVNALFAKSE